MKHHSTQIVCIWFFILSCTSLLGYTAIYFSPEDNIESILLTHIKNAQTKIYAAVFMLTSKKICDALCAARARNIDIQIISDASCAKSPYGKIERLKQAGIDVFIFKKKRSKRPEDAALMHHKFALIDNLVWTGSYNWTRSANVFNRENVVITDDAQAHDRYKAHFELLKRECSGQTNATQRIAPQHLDDKKFYNFTQKISDFLRVLAKKLTTLND